MGEITSRELVQRALAGQPTSRPPVGPLAVHYCAGLAGVSVRRYTTEAQVLADCVVRYWERFRPDAVWLSADTWVTAEAMGAAVWFTGEDQPLGGTGEPLVRERADVDRIPLPDPASQGRWPLMLDALRRVRQALGQEVFVVACFDQYPFSLACALMGIERLMLRLMDDPAMVEALLERCAEYTTAYGTALAQAEPDMLSGGDSPAGLLGPTRYRQIALPWERRVIERLKQATDKPISLHVCGDTTSMLADMATSGADVLELDHQVPIELACRVLPPHLAIWGNLDPVGLLAQSSPAEVAAAVRELIAAVRRTGRQRFVLSSGCTVATETPTDNLVAMLAAAR